MKKSPHEHSLVRCLPVVAVLVLVLVLLGVSHGLLSELAYAAGGAFDEFNNSLSEKTGSELEIVGTVSKNLISTLQKFVCPVMGTLCVFYGIFKLMVRDFFAAFLSFACGVCFFLLPTLITQLVSMAGTAK